jgi:integrase
MPVFPFAHTGRVNSIAPILKYPSQDAPPTALHIADLNRWPRMQRVAEVPDVRNLDRRHTSASLPVLGGAALEMIGCPLGHIQIGTTQRYARLIDARLRAEAKAVVEMLRLRL